MGTVRFVVLRALRVSILRVVDLCFPADGFDGFEGISSPIPLRYATGP